MPTNGSSPRNEAADGSRLEHYNHEKSEGAIAYNKARQELDNTIVDLDKKLHRVIAKQEYEYLKGYNVYVKQKERELKDTIMQLSDRYNNQSAKDKKVLTLQRAIKSIREDQIKMDHESKSMKETITTLRASNGELKQERDFFQAKTKEVKKKNQLLKLAIMRLQNELDEMKKQKEDQKAEEYAQEKNMFFITEVAGGKKEQGSPMEEVSKILPALDETLSSV